MASLDPVQLVDNVNRLHYPPTVYAARWIYGTWYCGNSVHSRTHYHGGYPGTFVRRVLAMFDGASMLHLCCGRAHIKGACNVDMQPLPEADVRANVEALPFCDHVFDYSLIDPPYYQEDSTRYGVKRLVRARLVLAECRRVIRPGGWILWLDEKYPSFRRHDMMLRGLIGICTGSNRRARFLSMFRVKPKEDL